MEKEKEDGDVSGLNEVHTSAHRVIPAKLSAIISSPDMKLRLSSQNFRSEHLTTLHVF